MSKYKPVTKKEEKWIKEFKEVAERCPKKLWLFSGAGTLYIMKTPEDGEEMTKIGGVNPENVITSIQITNSGGDW